ncbi:MAG: hypothetical protein ABIC95_05435 [archaeon]
MRGILKPISTISVVLLIALLALTGCQNYASTPEGQVCIPIEQAKELGILKGGVGDTDDGGFGFDDEVPAEGDGDDSLPITGMTPSEPGSETEPSEPTGIIVPPKTEAPAGGKTSHQDVQGNLPRKVIKEGELVSFPNLKATDPDGDPLTYSFTEPLDENGEWLTEEGDAGEYVVTITASDGKSTTSVDVLIIVEATNRVPTISGLSDITVNEGDEVRLEPVITDSEGDDVAVTYSGWMAGPTYLTNFNDEGTYIVTVTASDGKSQSQKTITVTVDDVNRPPVLSDFAPVTVTEGQTVEVYPIAIDQDKDAVSYRFEEPLDEDGIWYTKVGDAGSYDLRIEASDGKDKTEKQVKVIVLAKNGAPLITGLSDIMVNEGETIVLTPVISDPDGDDVDVSYSGWMSASSYTTSFNDAGVHKVTVSADDGIEKTTKTVTITVKDVNRAPVFNI